MADDPVEEHWPHVAALQRTLESLAATTTTVASPTATMPSSDIDEGHELIRKIKQYEIANGPGWRS